MDKISGIIPASPRVTKVDLTDAPGIRATLPNAERGVGAMSALGEQGTPQWRAKESRQAAVAAEVTNNFFMKAKPSEKSDSVEESDAPARQPQGLFPKGSFIDRSA